MTRSQNAGSQSSGSVYLCAQGTFTSEQAGHAEVPEDMPGVKGIFLGGCVERGIGKISDYVTCELAHAHIRGEYDGWVCFQLPDYLHDPEYDWIRMHELAHVLTGQGHTDAWRLKMEELGQPIPDRYRKRRKATVP